ncbi:MAG: flagella basal body P-ring formation protein FlgA [Deltaproteobacteria bacterium]|jgi:hypothetical protein|nr:flagella basal body P-ring formation protein FlgA [Deltaproteobacteria bacterium]
MDYLTNYLMKWFLFGIILLIPALVLAEEDRRLIVSIPQQVEVGCEQVTLGEIAEIIYKTDAQIDLASRLAELNLGIAPQPQITKQLAGEEILKSIEAIGISRNAIGYSIPQQVSIKRVNKKLDFEVAKPSNNQANKLNPKADKVAPLIVKGKPINVLYKDGLLSVMLSGTALGAADKNEVLMVKNTKSHKVIKTKVINSELAEALVE